MTRLPLDNGATKELTQAADSGKQHLSQEECLLQALAALPERCRNIIVWRHREQQSYEEIGGRLGLSLDAVRQLYREAIALVARELHQQHQC